MGLVSGVAHELVARVMVRPVSGVLRAFVTGVQANLVRESAVSTGTGVLIGRHLAGSIRCDAAIELGPVE
jgi:hypothetical protein